MGCEFTQVSLKLELLEAPLTLLRALRHEISSSVSFFFFLNALVPSISWLPFLVAEGFWKTLAVVRASVLCMVGEGRAAQTSVPCSRPAEPEKINGSG